MTPPEGGEQIGARVMAFRTVPLLLVHPGADRWTPLELSQPTFERVCAPKRLVVLVGAPHLPVTPPDAWTTLQGALRDFFADPLATRRRGIVRGDTLHARASDPRTCTSIR